ncbi:MAG: EI24 domain-containing protein [Caldimonas sp.]
MTLLLDAFWRAVAYCLHPRVILLSILPLLLVGGAAALLGYFFWEDAVTGVRSAMESWQLLAAMFQWLDSVGAGGLRSVLAPLVVVALGVPVVVVLSLLLVAMLMTPALVSLVAKRRFPRLERRHGAGFWQSAAGSLGCTVLALIALVVSIPFWLIPPLVLVLPPLIWGWLTYRVMAFDVLAEHATTEERRTILREQRWPMLGMGIAAGYLGAAPSLIWAFSALTLIFAPLLIVVAVWLYTLVFAFSALWFAHYALAALQALRGRAEPPESPVIALPPAQRLPGGPPALPNSRSALS